MIDTAMVLSAGLGTRFREISGDRPKPLVPVGGKALIDWVLDDLSHGGVSHAVVNVHYKAEKIEAHLSGRRDPKVTFSDEREALLETGGGLIKAAPHLGEGAVFCANTDAIMPARFAQGPRPTDILRGAWDENKMDALLLLVPQGSASGYVGAGDFLLAPDGRIERGRGPEALVFTGTQIIHPRLWTGLSPEPQSTRIFWDKAVSDGRLYGVPYSGRWLHVGDPDGYYAAQSLLSEERA